ncbi:Co2+/Mg2+ efflux protein ApaG [methane-oxidizing endosymbiont of Gigantopelta aegis]|uniref:Co2+/Mg2+ efflux protein ApaG n=1 Tax=methane-oxidizing endosymbiont of Gigantopelta aegis TaxID=2794938 RepID=UPI0018DDCEC6|nr:Co2+/Mg2+ efflux protein ApaG [methane-oxidizing endosymbiont of Gigantopelta aegis]
MSEKNKIIVTAKPRYIEAQSSPDDDRYVFSYTIHIENQGQLSARLLSRHWLITDANGKIQEVTGEGVIGKQPLIQPGESFSYSSGAVVETPVAVMQGQYLMENSDGEQFNTAIPKFTLSIPRVLH